MTKLCLQLITNGLHRHPLLLTLVHLHSFQFEFLPRLKLLLLDKVVRAH